MRIRLLAAALALTLPALPSLTPAAGATSTKDCLATVRGVDLQHVTILDLQHAMASGRITSRQLVQAYLRRIKAFDLGATKLNSIRVLNPKAEADAAALDAERRHGHVRGPLHGIPVLLKDNVGTTSVPTTAGSIALAGSVPKHEATIVTRLRAAGAVILGKTNLSEFANWVDLSMPNGYSSLGGQVVNAYTAGDPSGSSSGSGVAASMAFAAVTIGTETSGSILSPSDANSDVGVKPTLGIAATTGIIPLAPDFDVPGPITRNVTDAAAVLSAIASAPSTSTSISPLAPTGDRVPKGGYLPYLKRDALKGIRLGIPSGTPTGLLATAVADLKKAGATIVETDVTGDLGTAALSEIGLIPNEFKWSLNEYLATEARPKTGVKTLADVIAYNAKHPDKVKYGQQLLQVSDATPGNGPLATTTAVPTRAEAQAAIDGALKKDNLSAIVALGPDNANVGAAAGYPTVIVPAGYAGDGTRPSGLSFLGTAYSEPRLLGYAYAYERVSHRRVPPTALNSDLFPIRC